MEIPIKEAKKLSEKYGYEQIIILALKSSKKKNWFDGWSTTFNTDKQKCKFLGRIARILHYNLKAFYSNEEVTEKYFKQMNDKEER